MIKKHIKYTNYLGEEVEEDLYFNLTSVEQFRIVGKYGYGENKTLEDYVQYITKERDLKAMIAVIEDIILTAYGEKSDNGRTFIKKVNGRALRDDFEQSVAYAELFEELLSGPEKFKDFVAGAVEKQPKAGQ